MCSADIFYFSSSQTKKKIGLCIFLWCDNEEKQVHQQVIYTYYKKKKFSGTFTLAEI